MGDLCSHYSVHAVVIFPKEAGLVHDAPRVSVFHLVWGQEGWGAHDCVDYDVVLFIAHLFAVIYCGCHIIFVDGGAREIKALKCRHRWGDAAEGY